MSILLGSARTSHASKPGQVSTQGFYLPKSGFWLGYKPKDKPHKLARAMYDACENNHIGYSQQYRYTLQSNWQNGSKSIKLVNIDCSCDCSSLIHLCIWQTYNINLQGIFTTRSMNDILNKSNLFEIPVKVTSIKQCSDGMILLSEINTHTVMCIDTEYLNKLLIPDPVISFGDKGENVRQLQHVLNVINNAKLIEDGDFGNKTKLALVTFQDKQGITCDGVYNVVTKKKIKSIK